MDPVVAFEIMRSSESSREDSRQAACDLHNWCARGGYPVNGWTRDQVMRECKKYM